MKNIILAVLVGFGMLAFTGCTDSNDATVSKCQAGKCASDKAKSHKCQGDKEEGKCGADKKVLSKCGQ